MQPKIFILLLACSFGLQVVAQQNRFTLGVGYQRTWMLDKQASPLRYQTSEKTILLGYDHMASTGIFSAQLNGALGDFFPTGFKGRQIYDPGYNEDGTPKKDSSGMTGTLYSGRIKVSYLRQATSGYNIIGKGQLYSHNYFGASVNNQIFYSDNMVRTGWLNSASFNGEYMHTATLNTRHFFSIKISIPLFAENARLPYHNTIASPVGQSGVKTFFRKGNRFAWFGNFQNIQLDATYEYKIGNNWSMGLRYFGQWLHYSKERPINLLQNSIAITTSIK